MMQANQTEKSLIREAIVKIILYTGLVAGIYLMIFFDAQWSLTGKTKKFLEISYTEFNQEILLLLTAFLFWITGTRTNPKRSFGLLMSGFAALALCREFDFLCNCIFEGCWKIPAMMVIFSFGYLVYRHKDNFIHDAAEFIKRPEFGILLCGFLTVFVFSRLFGSRILWESVMGDVYMRCVKNAAEEGLELLGYLFIGIASVEYYLFKKKMGNHIDD
ncbi:MAG: hypothetical protein HF978_11050 [Desulfobacteraceae bacterium]|nr:hypothetical protein [Desulfobacteraceae bacterium]MBC2756073.1 hypothetical protein [Desulfobacteraceae bacterium]